MFDAAFSGVGGVSCACVFRFSTWCKSFAKDIGHQTWREKGKTFPSTFGERALLLDGFLRSIDSHNSAINPSRFARKPDLHTRPFRGDLRPKDRIEKCQSGLRNSIVFRSKTTSCNHSSWHVPLPLLWSALVFRPQSQFTFHAWSVSCAIARDVMRTVLYGIVSTLRRHSQNLRSNIPLYSVLYNEGHGHSWRTLRANGGIGDVWRGV